MIFVCSPISHPRHQGMLVPVVLNSLMSGTHLLDSTLLTESPHPRVMILLTITYITLEKSEGAHVAADPVGQVLSPMCFGISVAAGTQGCDEDMGLPDLPDFRIDDAHSLTSVVDEYLLSGSVGEPHGRVQLFGPQTVELAEAAVAIPIGMSFTAEGQATAGGGSHFCAAVPCGWFSSRAPGSPAPRVGLVWGRAAGRAGLRRASQAGAN